MIIATLFIISMALGAFFLLVAGLGIIRLPDAYCRMHASTKAASLGIGFLLLATGLFFWETAVTTKSLTIVAFIFLTAPVAGHLLGRGYYLRSDPKRSWENSDKLPRPDGQLPPK